MNEEEIQAAYGEKKTFAHYEKFMETVDNIKKDNDSGILVHLSNTLLGFKEQTSKLDLTIQCLGK